MGNGISKRWYANQQVWMPPPLEVGIGRRCHMLVRKQRRWHLRHPQFHNPSERNAFPQGVHKSDNKRNAAQD
ncbi:hypothetical protein M404DRAFT_996254 [Pisolithus tinctorius Marx 270]|uniref:Uncharacterized protein n=1 Tax=Pisolithus tinctorius Marx 270 TaxID=870435 RepID=A0A0C3JJX2_PISTI|nr:hypothetical protein M404DRAFT_996254 [Pisolithus tinctorius Marx 270]